MIKYWFFNVGDTEKGNYRHWEDNRRYGFISAGHGGPMRSKLSKVSSGDRVFAYVSRGSYGSNGYVGYGEVAKEITSLKNFIVPEKRERLVDLSLLQPRLLTEIDDPERCEYLLGVKWIKTYSREQAKYFNGIFFYKGTICQIDCSKHKHTIDYLFKEFSA